MTIWEKKNNAESLLINRQFTKPLAHLPKVSQISNMGDKYITD